MKVKTLAKFAVGEDIEGVEGSYEWTEFVFNTDAIDVYNEAEEGLTTIELASGMRQTIAIRWDEFEDLMGEPDLIKIDAKLAYEFSEQE